MLWPFKPKRDIKSVASNADLRGLPSVRWSERTARTYASEGYERCVIVARCVQIIARSVASIPVKIEINKKEIENHPAKLLLHRPNPMMSGRRFMEQVIAFQQITGNSYVEVLKAGSQPKELWPWMPFSMKIVEPKKGMMPLGFTYQDNDPSHSRTWDVDKVTGYSDLLHVKTFAPLDPWYGLSPIASAAYGVDQHNEANTWNMRLLQNASVPSGALMSKQTLTDGQFRKFKEELSETYQGAANARRPMVLSGDLSWIQMSLSPLEMDWLNGKNLSAREIAGVYGVPTQVIPIQGDQTFANYSQARAALWEDTVIPLARSVYDDMSRWMSHMYSEDICIELDLDEVPALEEARVAKWNKVNTCAFLTTNEKREAVGYDKLKDTPMADRVLLPGGQPMPTAEEQEAQEEEAQEEEAQEEEAALTEEKPEDEADLKEKIKRQLKAIGL